MKRLIVFTIGWLMLLGVLLSGCAQTTPTQPVESTAPSQTAEPTTEPVTTPTTQPPTIATEPITEPTTEPTTEPPTEPVTEPATEPMPVHSPLYIEGVAVEDVIRWFNEVCLDAEFVDSGNPSVIQKWVSPIFYYLDGTLTKDDMNRVNSIVQILNDIPGFPGLTPTDKVFASDLEIYICTQEELMNRMGPNFGNDVDGAVTFWYNWENQITNAVICVRSDLNQTVRNTVLLEEIYNGLGPVQDTALRPDSIISTIYNEVQDMTEIDLLILKLLYHPSIRCGMNAAQCEEIIRQLYY